MASASKTSSRRNDKVVPLSLRCPPMASLGLEIILLPRCLPMTSLGSRWNRENHLYRRWKKRKSLVLSANLSCTLKSRESGLQSGKRFLGLQGLSFFFTWANVHPFFRSPRFVSLKKQTFTHSHNELSHIILGQWFAHCESAQPSERRHPHIVGCPRGALVNALALLTCKSFRRLTFTG